MTSDLEEAVPRAEYERRLGLWIQNLESGEFAHGRHGLRVGQTYCCLGVACETFRRETGVGCWYGPRTESDFQAFMTTGSTHYLPRDVAAWFGIEPTGRGELLLSSTNDSRRTMDYSPVLGTLKSEGGRAQIFTWAQQ